MKTQTASAIQGFKLGVLQFHSGSKQYLLNALLQQIERLHATSDDHANLETGDTGFCVGYINPHVYNQSNLVPEVQQFIDQCNLVCLDGLGTCLAIKLKYGLFNSPPTYRVVALQLFDALVVNLSRPCNTVLIGVDADDVQLSASYMNRENSNFEFTGIMDGFRPATDYENFFLKHTSTHLILIGAGSPKSEAIALQAKRLCPNAIIFHIGAGTIKVYAGTKRRAPVWVSTCGLEWLHRMIFEPHTRERYTLGGWRFFRHVLQTRIKDTNKSLP